MKRTPLYDTHVRLGGRMVEFGGWEMPLQYTGIVDEHRAVRTAAGIFDISHMGEITVSGGAAGDFLNSVLTNDVRKLPPGGGQYTLLCNERGGAIDDLYLYRLSEEVYLMIVNASRTDVDVAWLHGRAAAFPQQTDLRLTDASHNYAAVAVQGPRVVDFIETCIPGPSRSGTRVGRVMELKKNQIGGFTFQGASVLVSRTGYTGEDGFEIVGRDASILEIWETVLRLGQPFGIKPAGLGARDTLRTEACYPLYGHELDESTTPLEAGLGRFVSLTKGEFTGRAALLAQQEHGLGRQLIAFTMPEKSAPPRPHYSIWAVGSASPVGEVVSGTQSPSLGIGIGLGYVPTELAEPGGTIEIEIRGRHVPARIVPRPIYRKIS